MAGIDALEEGNSQDKDFKCQGLRNWREVKTLALFIARKQLKAKKTYATGAERFDLGPLRLPLDRMEKGWSESEIKDMKAESQLTTVEVSRSMPMIQTRFRLEKY